MNYIKLNNITGWSVFAIATIVYILTVEPTTSLWDCGEYITTAYSLEVGHPPGAPLFMMLGRLFTFFVDGETAAYMINLMSALCSSFSILFLFWSITKIAKKVATKGGESLTDGKMIAILGSGAIGALAFTFSDSFWFSAVEGEVYAMSSFFTAIVFWAILKWEEKADEEGSDRWIIFIAFLVGLSIGVHLLNLLAIPAITFVYYFKKYKKATVEGILITGVLSIVILGMIQAVIIPGIVSLAAFLEIKSVNSFGLPFYSGAIIFAILMVSLIVFGVQYSIRKGIAWLNTIVMSFAVILIGYSCFAMIVIRSNADTPLDENNPEDLVSLLSYLNREQYGSWPIVKGPYWNSTEDPGGRQDGTPVYIRAFVIKQGKRDIKGFRKEAEAKEYLASKGGAGYSIEEKYYMTADRKAEKPTYIDGTTFPRMYSSDPNKIRGYRSWSKYTGDKNKPSGAYTDLLSKLREVEGVPPSPELDQYKQNLNDAIARLDRSQGLYVPTFGENLRYFGGYQVGWMYWRYFMWNFSGRQNDEQGDGNPLDGNWISGLNFIDKEHIGDQSKLSDDRKENIGYNKFYMLPFILGLIGLVFQMFKDPKRCFVVFLLFVFTGLAIVIYLNQKPFEPRERDYAYAGSFYAFAIWIGMGVYALFDAARNLKWNEFGKVIGGVAGLGVLSYIIGSGSGQGLTLSYSIFYILLIVVILHAVMNGISNVLKDEKTHAIAATLICVVVPFLMAFNGWNDHDRSNRYFARDNAKAYLDSCDDDAILFTHGDNDTFPLWYVQEVEGHGRNKRVVNLSLLGTDWYIEQMKRQAYESAPVPFSFSEEQIRQHGRRDVVLMPGAIIKRYNPQSRDGIGGGDMKKAYDVIARAKQQEYWDIREVLKIVKNDEFTISGVINGKVSYFPTGNFYLDITEEDKDNIIANGIVSESRRDEIVDRMEWKITSDFMYKNTLMILDLVANNNWERPIYFGASASKDAYAGLMDYFETEGMVYKLVPIKSTGSAYSQVGKVNTANMYDNLMNKFQWGNIDDPSVNIDYYIRRPSSNFRSQFAQLSQAFLFEAGEMDNKKKILDFQIKVITDSLSQINDDVAEDPKLKELQKELDGIDALKQEKLTKAKEVIERCVQVLPEENFPYDRVMGYVVGAYYQVCNQYYDKTDSTRFDEPNVLARKVLKASYEEAEYLLSLDNRFFAKVVDHLTRPWEAMNILMRGIQQVDPQMPMALEVSGKMNEIANQLRMKAGEIDRWEMKTMRDERRNSGSSTMGKTSIRIRSLFKEIFQEPTPPPTQSTVPGQ